MKIPTKLIFVCSLLFSLSLSAEKLSDAFFDDADMFLKKYVKNSGRVNYAAIQNESGEDDIVNQIEEMDLSEASSDEKKAFYINAYNISVIAQVVEHYPVSSVLTGQEGLDGIDGFFNVNKRTVAGEEITLDFLEKELLIKAYADSRIHFVVVCAAISCPPLIRDAYRPETVEAQIEEQTSSSINDGEFTRINRNDETVVLSQIYNWFIDDFGGSATSTIAFLNEYLDEPINNDYEVSYYRYNWAINELLGDPNGLFDGKESEISVAISNDEVTFSDENGVFQLIDLNGQIYASGNTNRELDLNLYETGIYILRVEFKEGIHTEKIFVD